MMGFRKVTSATRQPWGSMSSCTSCLSLSKKSSNFRNLRAHRPLWSRQNTASSSSRALSSSRVKLWSQALGPHGFQAVCPTTVLSSLSTVLTSVAFSASPLRLLRPLRLPLRL